MKLLKNVDLRKPTHATFEPRKDSHLADLKRQDLQETNKPLQNFLANIVCFCCGILGHKSFKCFVKNAVCRNNKGH